MAVSIEIHGTDSSLKVIVDGAEIHDVMAYKLEDDPRVEAVPVLTLKIAVMGEVEVQQ